ncbi:MAG: polyamine aminopropyltransferase [Myxococcota bacterium]|nr:polyamine aminopropyltransferase [Myxococcota bacterium]
MNTEIAQHKSQPREVNTTAILFAVLVIAVCGLVYELIASTLASYVLGDSVTQFSTVIGVYLSAMGLGSWLSSSIKKNVLSRFIEVEILVALIGGCSAAFLFLAFSHVSAFRLVLYTVVVLIGTLVGLEIPLLMRILKDKYEFKDLLARVLTFDYLGALIASLAFPMFVMPKLGLIRGSLFIGLLNAFVALSLTFFFEPEFKKKTQLYTLRTQSFVVIAILVAGILFSENLTKWSEDELYTDNIIYAKRSKYQRLVITQSKGSFHLYLNGNLQFSSTDEHRYHEALVHPPFSVVQERYQGDLNVLVLGGGDGLAVREILKYPAVKTVTLVDLDPQMTELARNHPLLSVQNQQSLNDSRVSVINDDAMTWLARDENSSRRFDVIVIDFPDPNSFSLGKLYTTRFYRLVKRVLAEHGALTIQSTSPLLARRSFWCVDETVSSTGFKTRAFHATVPSFGAWGYVLASPLPFDVPTQLPPNLKYLTPEVMKSMFVFPKDMDKVPTEVNRLNNQVLVQYYDSEWSSWY